MAGYLKDNPANALIAAKMLGRSAAEKERSKAVHPMVAEVVAEVAGVARSSTTARSHLLASTAMFPSISTQEVSSGLSTTTRFKKCCTSMAAALGY